MGKTKIEWATDVWNPITGVRFHIEEIWKSFGKKPKKIFVQSMGDLFHGDIKNIDRYPIIVRIIQNPQHTFMFLTKRPKNCIKFINWLTEYRSPVFTPLPLPNLWLGITAENQALLDYRLPYLLKTNAAVKFISFEPLLGPINAEMALEQFHSHDPMFRRNKPPIDWIIVGAETGPGARCMNPEWARDIRDQCKEAGVSFFMKQMSNNQPIPDDLMIREFPEVKDEH